jgi:translation elongation factor EF-G
MGELHLEILMERLFREFNIGAVISQPQIAYKETIRRPVKGSCSSSLRIIETDSLRDTNTA